MRTARFVHAWSAIVLASGASVGCAAATRSAPEGLRSGVGIAEWTPAERRQMRDSANAQAVADEVGPRVTVMADFDYAGEADASRPPSTCTTMHTRSSDS